jgi:signal transduction histidine kinase
MRSVTALAAAASDADTLSLLDAAARCRRLRDFYIVLHELAGLCNAQGCVLWELIAYCNPTWRAADRSPSTERRLVALADAFDGGLDWYYLPRHCNTRDAVDDQMRRIVDVDHPANESGESLERLRAKGVKHFCSFPISLDGRREAAVNLYRHIDQPFTEAEADRIEQLVGVIPRLFNPLHDAVHLRLVQDVDRMLREGGMKAVPAALDRIADSFGALECSVYLEDPLLAPGVYSLYKQIWPWSWQAITKYTVENTGMTSYVIRNQRTIRFLDLSNFDEEVKIWGYEGVAFPNEKRLRDAAHRVLGSRRPLSFVCAPIKYGGAVIGAIRLCVTHAGPHLYDDGHVRTIEQIADQIGERWGTQINARRAAEEQALFQEFARKMDGYKTWFFNSLKEGKEGGSTGHRQLQMALDLLDTSGCFGEALSIRLIDPARRELCLEASAGQPWKEAGRKTEERARRQPITRETPEGIAVLENRIVRSDDPGMSGVRPVVFPGARRFIHAPIVIGTQVIGVVDIFGFDDPPFAPALGTIAGLLAQQLGLHYHTFEQFRQLVATTQSLRDRNDEQAQVYEDFEHQLRDPINKAYHFAEQAIAIGPSPEILRQLRGNARRSEHVANNIRHFGALAKGQLGQVPREVLTTQNLLARLQQMAEDQESLVSYLGKQMRFSLDADSFDVLNFVTARANLDLLEHSLMNLLDNAAKYGHNHSDVTVAASTDHRRSVFRLSVFNRGDHVSPAEKHRLVERGYRGHKARLRVVTGQGLGLYIVDKFMEAMQGRLEIVPTDNRGLNEFRLVWPVD